jgi:deoxycytidine triphosphate deaminase
MMMTSAEIRDAIASGELQFTGEVRGDALLLTLGATLLPFSQDSVRVEPWNEISVNQSYSEPLRDWHYYDLAPHAMVLASVMQDVQLPDTITGDIGTLSHVARLGLSAHLTSPFVGACFRGHLTLEVVNLSGNTLALRADMPVAKIILFRHSPSEPDRQACDRYGSENDLRSRFHQEYGERWG